MATVGVIASLKPRPPSSPRSSLTDVTNGASGLLSGKGGSSDGEVARLSDKILSLMSQIHARDEQVRKLEESLALARREAGNAKNLLATGGKITTPPSDASLDDASARARGRATADDWLIPIAGQGRAAASAERGPARGGHVDGDEI